MSLPYRTTLLCLLLPASSAIAADPCSGLPATRVEVKLLESPIQFSERYSFKSLKGMSNRYADAGVDVLGLTIGKAQVRASSRSTLRRDPSGQWECSTHQINIEFGYQPISLHVGREFPQGSCAFQEIHAHEMRHAKIYQDTARQLIDEVSKTLHARFDDMPPMRGPAGSTAVKIQNELNERWIPYIKRLLEKAESLQREVDSPEEYARIAGSCNGDIRQIVRQSKPHQ